MRHDAQVRFWLGRFAVSALVMAAGMMLGWPLLGESFSRLFQASASATLGSLEYGAGGHTRFSSEQGMALDTQRADSWDTQLELRIDGVRQTHAVALNPRRLAYLPVLTLVALLAAAPLRARAKLLGLAAGAALLWTCALGWAWITAVWLFSRIPKLVYDLSPGEETALRLAYEALVTSLASKFILPLLMVVSLAVWQTGRVSARG